MPTIRPLPITFAPNATEPTPEGLEAIAALAQCLRAQGQSGIVLSGHADSTGSSGYNLALSQRRLDRVAALLKQEGFGGRIKLEARGEDEPLRVDMKDFSRADALRLSRRIELRSLEGGAPDNC